jgi:hypothetical protein
MHEPAKHLLAPLAVLGLVAALSLQVTARAEMGGHGGGQGGHWGGQMGSGGFQHGSESGNFQRQQGMSGSSRQFSDSQRSMAPRSESGDFSHQPTWNSPSRVSDAHRQMVPRVVAPPRMLAHPRIVQTLPPNHQVFVHRGTRFFFAHGFFFRAHGPRFITVFPPIGLFVPFLPVYASVVWIAGAPYYYANDVYYTRTPQGYVVAQPPPGETIVEEPANNNAGGGNGVIEQPAGASTTAEVTVSKAPGDGLYIYPGHGQNEQQQGTDRNECHSWAVGQTGYDPMVASSGYQVGDRVLDFQRAISACLEARGYTVR